MFRIDPQTGIRLMLDAQRADAPGAAARSRWTWSSREEGGEGATPYEVLLHAALIGDSTHFTRQDGVEQTWRDHAAAARRTAEVASLRAGVVGPEPRATSWSRRYGGWHGPWVPS